MQKLKTVTVKPWMVFTLALAGVYNIIWGSWVVFFPESAFDLAKLELPNYMMVWQALGMIMAALGLAYLAASIKPFVHWPIVLVGLLIKVFSPIGFAYNVMLGNIPSNTLYIVITNDLIWWIPLGAILYNAYLYHRAVDERLNYFYGFGDEVDISEVYTNKQNNLFEMSIEHPVMLVFLRHFGCTFCRESLDNIRHERSKIENNGTKLVLVHMVDNDEEAKEELSKYKLEDVDLISDPNCSLYQEFGLEHGSFYQLFGYKVLARFLYAGIFKGHFVGKIKGTSATQMPGVFLLKNGEIIKSYKHFTAADTPDYTHIASFQKH